MDFTSSAFWGALLAIVVADLLLSGDNAVVIALAARGLPPAHQKRAIVWGSAGAIGLRVVLTLAAIELLNLPYLRLVGGVLLFWIGVQLLSDNESTSNVQAQGTLFGAIRTILVADFVMSLDNVIAVASAASHAPEHGQIPLLIFGLLLSVPLMVFGSSFLIRWMERFPIIITLGAAMLGFLAGSMVTSEPWVAQWLQARLPHASIVVGSLGAVLVVVVAKGWARRRVKHESS